MIVQRGNKMQLSSLIGKQILSPAGELLGYVKGAYLGKDFLKLSALVCIDGDEEEFYLPARAILAAEDAVIAGKGRLEKPVGAPCPVGQTAYTEKGEYLGLITDFLYGEEGVTPVLIATKEGVRTPLPVDLITVGDTVMLRDAKSAKPVRVRPTKKPAAKASEKTPEKAPAEEAPSEAKKPSEAGQVINFNRWNLIGRTVKKTVYDSLGMPIVLAGEKITPEVLNLARRNGRLLQLTVNPLTNIL